VGLEHLLSRARASLGEVTIPHGGVKTSPKKPENQNFLPLKIETAHREGTLTHIQLPS